MRISAAQASNWEAIYLLIENNMQTMQLGLGLPWDKQKILQHVISQETLVAMKNNRLLGFISYELRPERQIIHSLQVTKPDQGGLLGYRLFKAAFIKGESIASAKAEVSCRVFENNQVQQRYYALGFNDVSRHKGILALTMPRQQLKQKLNLC